MSLQLLPSLVICPPPSLYLASLAACASEQCGYCVGWRAQMVFFERGKEGESGVAVLFCLRLTAGGRCRGVGFTAVIPPLPPQYMRSVQTRQGVGTTLAQPVGISVQISVPTAQCNHHYTAKMFCVKSTIIEPFSSNVVHMI